MNISIYIIINYKVGVYISTTSPNLPPHRWKGKLLHVICKLKLFLIDQKMARGKITQEVFLKELNSCIVGLDEVSWENDVDI